ncbi:uncharacterized protein LOC121053556 [Oryza brachyantha]|uniref:uncharacterized protein LOC121053556 n=1 Tax=Oryza brachyantha TaxID=4533 RepID=UPI001ADBDB02|nr:uncharacterized protein LOC121053556 [Oryza brachyantha]
MGRWRQTQGVRGVLFLLQPVLLAHRKETPWRMQIWRERYHMMHTASISAEEKWPEALSKVGGDRWGHGYERGQGEKAGNAATTELTTADGRRDDGCGEAKATSAGGSSPHPEGRRPTQSTAVGGRHTDHGDEDSGGEWTTRRWLRVAGPPHLERATGRHSRRRRAGGASTAEAKTADAGGGVLAADESAGFAALHGAPCVSHRRLGLRRVGQPPRRHRWRAGGASTAEAKTADAGGRRSRQWQGVGTAGRGCEEEEWGVEGGKRRTTRTTSPVREVEKTARARSEVGGAAERSWSNSPAGERWG